MWDKEVVLNYSYSNSSMWSFLALSIISYMVLSIQVGNSVLWSDRCASVLNILTIRKWVPVSNDSGPVSAGRSKKRLNNCKGPHTISTANVGATRDLSAKKIYIKTRDYEADTP